MVHFDIRKMQLMVICTEPNKISQIFNQRQQELKQNVSRLVFHIRSLKTLSIISIILTWNLWYQDGFLMKEKHLRLTYLSQTKINIFQKKFCEKLEFYTNGKVKFNIIWATRKIKSLFEIKDNVKHPSCVIYQRICNCGNNYIDERICSCGSNEIDETIRNTVTRTDKHEQWNCKSEPSKHLKNNAGHKFDWMILSWAPLHCLKRRILEAFFIKQLNPSLNDKLDSEILILFRHGVT